MADTNWGEGYRGGYGGGVSLQDIEGGIRDATSTFINYVSGTVQLVFMIAFVFMFISILTLCLMIYARYLAHRKPLYGFYNPPAMLMRYPKKAPTYAGSTLPRSDYSQATTARQPPSSVTAASQHSLTAASTML